MVNLGSKNGYALNPARDLGPRLFAALLFGVEEAFACYNLHFLVPLFGPILGAVCAGWIHDNLLIYV